MSYSFSLIFKFIYMSLTSDLIYFLDTLNETYFTSVDIFIKKFR